MITFPLRATSTDPWNQPALTISFRYVSIARPCGSSCAGAATEIGAFTGTACTAIATGVAAWLCGMCAGWLLAASAGVGVNARAIGACGAENTDGATGTPPQPASRQHAANAMIITLCVRGIENPW